MKPVLVTVESIQRNENGEEITLELVSEGKFYAKDRAQYIVYEESEITGMAGVTTVIKIPEDGTGCLLRLGSLKQRQEYAVGRESRSTYETPVGIMGVTMKTYECDVALRDGVGTIRLGFDVTIEGVGANYNQVTITVREDKS